MNEYIDVAIPVGVRRTFAYSVPPEFRSRVAAGMRVLVPFGRNIVTGYVVGLLDRAPVGDFKIRAVHDLIDSTPAISALLVETALWVSRYYFAPPGDVLRALFPIGTQIQGERTVSLAPRTAMLLDGGFRPPGLKPQEEALLDILRREPSLTVKELAKRSNLRGAETWIESLASDRWIQVETSLGPPKTKIKEQWGIRLSASSSGGAAGLPPAQKRLYAALGGATELRSLQEVLRIAKSTPSAAKALDRKGLAEMAPMRVQRLPPELSATEEGLAPTLTPQQQEVVSGILNLIQQTKAARCLVHGVTGSGKTEIYLRLIAEVLHQGGTALFLVPEIGLTPLLSRLVVSRFPDRVSLLHSGMSAGERLDQWNRIRDGVSKVVVGTRSAVFAPLDALRLVIIDEEQDASYKQDESPCYHAREVAWQRVQQTHGVLVMGSATPSMETFYQAQKGEAGYYYLPERIEARPLPQVTVVDMCREFQRLGKNAIVSQALLEELENCMQRKEQAIILLNRRGYSRTLLCRSCGHVFTCPDCSVSMTYHRQENRIACHYCGREGDPPSRCDRCGGAYIHYAGVGTEQLESLLQSRLPAARIARLDRDTTRRRGVLRSALLRFASRKLDILVGTQILAKGHDFPDVTMVGVVAADAGLSFPDFRSAERTFHLLLQVAGRAGRGGASGHVVLQSYHPENYALQYAQKQDYFGFYNQEIDFRRALGYPPFRNLIQILIRDTDAAKAGRTAEKIADTIKRRLAQGEAGSGSHVLGPAAAPLEKIRGNYRMQILVKCPAASNVLPLLQECFEDLNRCKISSSKIHVDVDPLSLL
jgi:primosomal protein N' (replication factor Y) (superfamily II helicase)